MNDNDSMKLMDLSEELGLVLEKNPVWKKEKEYVIYGGNLDDAYVMLFNSDNGHWEILTRIGGVLNLSQEALTLMDSMSKLAKGKEE